VFGAVCTYGIPQNVALPSQERKHQVTKMGMGATEHATEGLGEGHWSNWEAMREEAKKRFKSLTFMNVFNFFYLKNISSHASVREVFMYSNFKTNSPFHNIH